MKSLNELPVEEHIRYLEKQKKEIENQRYLTPHKFKIWKYLKNEINRLKRELKWSVLIELKKKTN